MLPMGLTVIIYIRCFRRIGYANSSGGSSGISCCQPKQNCIFKPRVIHYRQKKGKNKHLKQEMDGLICTIGEIQERICPIAEKYHLKAVYLFDSDTRNEANADSDIDLLVDTSGTEPKSLLSLGGLYCGGF